MTPSTTQRSTAAKLQGQDEILVAAPIERLWSLIADSTRLSEWGPPVRNGPVWPAGITTTMGRAFFAAIKLSRMNPARPTEVHDSSQSPAPCSR